MMINIWEPREEDLPQEVKLAKRLRAAGWLVDRLTLVLVRPDQAQPISLKELAWSRILQEEHGYKVQVST